MCPPILGHIGTAQGIPAAVPPALGPWPGCQEFRSGLHETALQKEGELPAKIHGQGRFASRYITCHSPLHREPIV